MLNTSVAFSPEVPNVSFGKVVGATFLVAGTCVGAGMLALPLVSIGAGFLTSCVLMTIMCAFMGFSALVALELNLKHGKGVSVVGLAEKTFGRAGQVISILALLLLFHALTAAYITGGSGILVDVLREKTGMLIPFPVVAGAFTLFFATFVYLCTRAVDYANRFLFIIKAIVFLGMIVALLPLVNHDAMLFTPASQWSATWLSIPIFFTSFGFHGSIPTLVNYVGPHPRYLRGIIIIGTLIPLGVYLLWEAATVGVLKASDVPQDADLATFMNLLSAKANYPFMGILLKAFSFFGVTTSFLGVTIGLFDFTAEARSAGNTATERFKTALLTFIPPFLFALFYPNGFMVALRYAAIALSLLAVLLPAVMAMKWRKNPEQFKSRSTYEVAGGTFALILSLLGGSVIITVEVIRLLS